MIQRIDAQRRANGEAAKTGAGSGRAAEKLAEGSHKKGHTLIESFVS
jgi:hypothetical protein